MVTIHNKIHEESLKGGGSAFGEEDSCRNDGHCSGTMKERSSLRKLLKKHIIEYQINSWIVQSERSSNKRRQSTTPREAATTRRKSQTQTRGPAFCHAGSQPSGTSSYPDILDIAGMDYSPAKRKPPIHN
uniref:Uncharacterized protein n=1 Tax=Ananas comosus var. bracteatus TaxID=296719 RepID=A0A6V7P4I5_ANACO|nr:unnamed protein product [Ananas comosus var. bracteatus]